MTLGTCTRPRRRVLTGSGMPACWWMMIGGMWRVRTWFMAGCVLRVFWCSGLRRCEGKKFCPVSSSTLVLLFTNVGRMAGIGPFMSRRTPTKAEAMSHHHSLTEALSIAESLEETPQNYREVRELRVQLRALLKDAE